MLPVQRNRLTRLARLIPNVLLSLSGRGNARFITELVAQVDAAITGATLTRQLVSGELKSALVVEQMRVIEHAGDAARARLVADLRASFVTPLDREDLFRLSRSLDDILDELRDFVRAWDMFKMRESAIVEPMVDAICNALADLRGVIAEIDKSTNPAVVGRATYGAKWSGHAIRKTYDVQLAALYSRPLTMETLKIDRCLRRLDVVGIRFAEATDHLADALVKRAED
jgi:hypothetical protein